MKIKTISFYIFLSLFSLQFNNVLGSESDNIGGSNITTIKRSNSVPLKMNINTIQASQNINPYNSKSNYNHYDNDSLSSSSSDTSPEPKEDPLCNFEHQYNNNVYSFKGNVDNYSNNFNTDDNHYDNNSLSSSSSDTSPEPNEDQLYSFGHKYNNNAYSFKVNESNYSTNFNTNSFNTETESTKKDSFAKSENQLRYEKHLCFLSKSKLFWNKVSDRQKAFLGILSIAAAIYKRDKLMSMLMATLSHLRANKFTYALIYLFAAGVQKNIIVFNPLKSLKPAYENIINLPGETYVLKLSDKEYYSQQTMKQYIASKRGQPFEFARVTTRSQSHKINCLLAFSEDEKVDVHYCDAATLDRDLYRGYSNDFSSEYYIGINFFGEKSLKQVHYFKYNGPDQITYLGSNYEQRTLEHYTNSSSPGIILKNLGELENTIDSYDASKRGAQFVVKALNLVIGRFNNEKLKDYTPHIVHLAKYLIAMIYKKQGKNDLARKALFDCNPKDAILAQKVNDLKIELENQDLEVPESVISIQPSRLIQASPCLVANTGAIAL